MPRRKTGRKVGRPKLEIDMDELGKLAAMQCTQDEVAAWFGIGRETIKRRLKEPKYRNIYEEGQGKGRVSLRRTQFRLAETNAGMAIFLGKNFLGQSDKTETVHSGTIGIDSILGDIDGRTAGLSDDQEQADRPPLAH